MTALDELHIIPPGELHLLLKLSGDFNRGLFLLILKFVVGKWWGNGGEVICKWWGNISKSQISYVIFIHTPSGNITLTTARGVYNFQKLFKVTLKR